MITNNQNVIDIVQLPEISREEKQLTILSTDEVIIDDFISFKMSTKGSIYQRNMKHCEVVLVGKHELTSEWINIKRFIASDLVDNGNLQEIDYGDFGVLKSEYDDTTQRTKLTCYDRMLQAQIPYDSEVMNLTYPMTISQVLNRLAIVCKLDLVVNTVNNLYQVIHSDLWANQSFTYADVLDHIAQATTSIIAIRDNKLEIFNPIENDFTIQGKFNSLKMGETFGKTNIVNVSQEPQHYNKYAPINALDIPLEERKELAFSNNPILNQDMQTWADRLYLQTKDLEYSTFESSTIGYGIFEVGDMVDVYEANEDIMHRVMITNETFDFKHALVTEIGSALPMIHKNQYVVETDQARQGQTTYFVVDQQNGVIRGVVDNVTENTSDIAQLVIEKDNILLSLENVQNEVDNIELTKVYNAYSANSNGVPFYETPRADTKYWGTASAINRPTLAGDYVWSLIQGPEGARGEKGNTGSQGATGEKGPKGDTGTSVSSVVEWYLATNLASGVTTSTSGWATTMQPMTATKKYLWNYEVINFSDGSSSPTLPVIIGVHGNTGATGRALTGITEYYLASASASGVTRPSTDGTNGWTTAMQTTSTDKPYLWNYEKLTWSVAPTTSYINPIIIGIHGAKGTDGTDGTDGKSVFMAYADLADGTGFSLTDDTKDWLGLYIGLPPQSTTPSDYNWSPSGYGNAKEITRVSLELDSVSGSVDILSTKVNDEVDKTAQLRLDVDSIESTVSNIPNGNLLTNGSGELGFLGWSGGSRARYVTPKIRYMDGLTYSMGFIPQQNPQSLAEWEVSFYNNGFDVSPIAFIVPNIDHSYRAKVSKFKPFNIDVLEFNDLNRANALTANKVTNFAFNSPMDYVQFTFTPSASTQFVRFKYNRIGVTTTDRLNITEVMFNRGQPKDWQPSPNNDIAYSRSTRTQLGNKIEDVVTEVDRLSGDIHNAGVEINARDGVTTYGKKFEVKSEDRSETYMIVTDEGLTVTNATILGDLIAGSIANLLYDNDGITFKNGKLKLNSLDNSIDFGTLRLFVGERSQEGFEGDYLEIRGQGDSKLMIGNLSLDGTPLSVIDSDIVSTGEIVSRGGYPILLGGIHGGDVEMSGTFYPTVNGWMQIGTNTKRVSNLYLQNQPNVASDVRYKYDIQDIDPLLLEIIGREVKPKQYRTQFDDKIHFGYIAQDVERALYKYCGNDKDKYAMLSKDESYMSLLYGELNVIIEAYNRKRNDELEERIKALEELK